MGGCSSSFNTFFSTAARPWQSLNVQAVARLLPSVEILSSSPRLEDWEDAGRYPVLFADTPASKNIFTIFLHLPNFELKHVYEM
jgi:hypothetical protein